ncbi:hypothetical protein KAH43_08380 [Candidatus Bipolaricaulota bacterium]|nr:hypothetical protein [Candidatus Bipolaricaulota bacterium]
MGFLASGGSRTMICPHCQTKGTVRTRVVEMKRGISGSKAMGGLVTGGISLLLTGLARKERVTRARCKHCRAVWHY